MKSKSKIEKQLKRKTNPLLAETIIFCKKNKKWFKIAEILTGSRKKRINLNLGEINKRVKNGERVVIPGKVLSQGELDKKIKIIALNFSERAMEKIKKCGSDVSTILEEIKKNPEAKGFNLLKK